MTETATSKYLKSLRFVAFDTETTGLWAVSNRIVEIAAVRFGLGDEKTEIFEELVYPERKIPPEVIKIHGITDEMVAESDTVKPVLERFIEFCRPDDILIAHNAPFDISFIACELERVGLDFPDNLIIDTVDISRKYLPGQRSYSLLSLSRALGIAQSQEHRALADAYLVKEVFANAVPKMDDINNINSLKSTFVPLTMDSGRNETVNLPEKFSDLSVAIEKGWQVEMVYAIPDREPYSQIIKPLSVHELRSVIYLNALCEKKEAERTFRLDRIESLRLLDNQGVSDL